MWSRIRAELSVIEEVEKLRPELRVEALVDHRVLEKRHIDVVQSSPAQNIPSRAAERPWPRLCEGVPVEYPVGIDRIRSMRVADDIRPREAARQGLRYV